MRGVGQIYRFTLVQHFKNRTNLITLIIMLVLSMITVPLSSVLMSGMDGTAEDLTAAEEGWKPTWEDLQEISALYLYDESGYELSPELADAEGVSVTALTAPMREEEITSLSETAVYVHVWFDAVGGVYRVKTHTGELGALKSSTIHNVALCVSAALERARGRSLTEEELTRLAQIGRAYAESGDAAELLREDTTDVGLETSFAVGYVYSILLLMLCMMSSSFIIRAVVEEKSSRVIDLLMVSVHPLALLCGKILAMMTVVFGSMLAIGAGVGLSTAVSGLFLDTSVIGGGLESMGISLSLLDLGWGTLAVTLVSLVLSYLTYSIMSGIAGATCSSMNDTEAAMLGVTFTALFGYIASTVVTAVPNRAMAIISSLIPFVSAFCAPVHYICGRIGFLMLMLSWLTQAALVVGLALFGARIYRDLILYRGKRMRLGEVLRIAKNQKGGAAHEA